MDSNKTVKKVTAKRKQILEIPVGETVLYQPNTVTNGRFEIDTSIYRMKILVSIIANLQEHMINNMRGVNLTLFDSVESYIELKIPFADIGPAQKYAEVEQSIEALRQITVKFPSKAHRGYTSHVGLIQQYDIPTINNGQKKFFFIKIGKDIAQHLIHFEKDLYGKPKEYTKYFYEITMSFKSTYTMLLYWLISSWKIKGGFVITLDDLRARLGVKEGQYKNYSNFKKIILERAQKEMEGKADCWFNCAEKDFEIKKGKKVVSLSFKVISPELLNEQESRSHILLDNIKNLLQTHFKFDAKEMGLFQEIINKSQAPIDLIHEKAIYLMEYMRGKAEIINKKSYFLTSFEKEFIT